MNRDSFVIGKTSAMPTELEDNFVLFAMKKCQFWRTVARESATSFDVSLPRCFAKLLTTFHLVSPGKNSFEPL